MRMSGNPMITSIQLSITLAVIPRKVLSDCVTSLKKVKSKTTVQYHLYCYLIQCHGRRRRVVSADLGAWPRPAAAPTTSLLPY